MVRSECDAARIIIRDCKENQVYIYEYTLKTAVDCMRKILRDVIERKFPVEVGLKVSHQIVDACMARIETQEEADEFVDQVHQFMEDET